LNAAVADLTREVLFRLPLRETSDVAAARHRSRQVAQAHALDASAVEALAIAVTEIASNAILHGRGGELLLGVRREPGRLGVFALARDDGPGIPDIEAALRDGYTTGAGLGLGLPSARRFVDDLEITTTAGQGTTVTLTQWQRSKDEPRPQFR
jgi:serine/threonine-protein kinase RsbT